jgi:hypothetical protein
MAKFPSQKELKEVRDALEKAPASRMLSPKYLSILFPKADLEISIKKKKKVT